MFFALVKMQAISLSESQEEDNFIPGRDYWSEMSDAGDPCPVQASEARPGSGLWYS